MTVSRQSAVNAGEKTRTFLMPLLEGFLKHHQKKALSQLFS